MTSTSTPVIAGLQQVGLGVSDLPAAFRWYRRHVHLDVRIFEDTAEAALMTRYTGGTVWKRHALLALNLEGGAGLELWQFTDRTPAAPPVPLQLGDLGIFAVRVKARDVAAVHERLTREAGTTVGPLEPDAWGASQFWLQDPFGNWLQVVEGYGWFGRGRVSVGGVYGCWLGVSDIDRALPLYRDVLGYDRLLGDREGAFRDLALLPGGGGRFRRVRLGHGPRQGALSALLGPSELELVQVLDRPARRAFEGRFWGDLGFIHLCFDVARMDALERLSASHGFPFTVDSGRSFGMGQASGRFAYVDDPDGTLVEFVETHRIPVFAPLGLSLDLTRRDPTRPLPSLLIRALALHRVR